jgi:hypothetical protein
MHLTLLLGRWMWLQSLLRTYIHNIDWIGLWCFWKRGWIVWYMFVISLVIHLMERRVSWETSRWPQGSAKRFEGANHPLPYYSLDASYQPYYLLLSTVLHCKAYKFLTVVSFFLNIIFFAIFFYYYSYLWFIIWI